MAGEKRATRQLCSYEALINPTQIYKPGLAPLRLVGTCSCHRTTNFLFIALVITGKTYKLGHGVKEPSRN